LALFVNAIKVKVPAGLRPFRLALVVSMLRFAARAKPRVHPTWKTRLVLIAQGSLNNCARMWSSGPGLE
jgi:hypothetical protein